MPKTPKVFISYAHEGKLSQQVKSLVDYLLENRIDVITDHPYENRPPEKGWTAWMQHSVEDSDFVLIVCTSRYKNIFEKREIPERGGKGATWEGAIITQDIYDTYLCNTKFYPVLPDDTDIECIPQILRAWDCKHYFPSGYERILKLIIGEVPTPTPSQSVDIYVPGELRSQDDNRLQVARAEKLKGNIIGRDKQIDQVLAFLQSSPSTNAVCSHVKGPGGIGKTEICKAALKRWLSTLPKERAFWIQVSDKADSDQLLTHLGQAMGLNDDSLTRIGNLDDLAPHLKDGLYYLDNLENVAESEGGTQLLKALSQMPGKRLLASCRVDLSHVLGEGITIKQLDTPSAHQLFTCHWPKSVHPPEDELSHFLEQELGNHPLSIVLISNLGKYHSWPALVEKWQHKGTSLAKQRKATDRIDSLDISLALTASQIQNTEGANDLWQFIALFPEGIDEHILNHWEKVSEQDEASEILVDHHILDHTTSGRFRLLPPIARYALAREQGNGFSWSRARQLAYNYFLSLSHAGSKTVSSENATLSRIQTAQQMWAIVTLVNYDQVRQPDLQLISKLNRQLSNIYLFNVMASKSLLKLICPLLNNPSSEKNSGNIEARLGNIDQARSHYDNAIELYQNEQDQLGLANALRALGDLENLLGNIDQARHHYDKAIELYQNEQDQLGLANALRALGDLENRLGNIDKARRHYDKAIELYQNEKSQLGLANALKVLGDLERRLDNIDQARSHYDNAMGLYQKEQVKLGLANTLEALGDLERKLGNIDRARSHYDNAIEFYQNEQSKLGLANALKALGDLERKLGNIDQARSRYDNAIGLYQKQQDQLGLANTYQSYGDSCLMEANSKQAIEYYSDALILYREEHEPMGLAYALVGVLRCLKHLKVEDEQQLRSVVSEAISAAKKSGVESVSHYVASELVDYFDGNKTAAEVFVKSLHPDET